MDENQLLRPKKILQLAKFYFVLGVADLVFALLFGLLFPLLDIGLYFYPFIPIKILGIPILWGLCFSVSLGLLRGSNFAKFTSIVVGLFAWGVPSIISIYVVFFSDAKGYFKEARCWSCGKADFSIKPSKLNLLKCDTCGKETVVVDAQ